MTKEYIYTYTRAVDIDFDFLIERYELNHEKYEGDLKEPCRSAIENYVDYTEDDSYWLLHGHEEEIANDLYNYIQSKTC